MIIMAKGSLRKRTKKMGRWIVSIASMPYFWLAISIFIMMIIAAVISYLLHHEEMEKFANWNLGF